MEDMTEDITVAVLVAAPESIKEYGDIRNSPDSFLD
jgi:hypothetical protein